MKLVLLLNMMSLGNLNGMERDTSSIENMIINQIDNLFNKDKKIIIDEFKKKLEKWIDDIEISKKTKEEIEKFTEETKEITNKIKNLLNKKIIIKKKFKEMVLQLKESDIIKIEKLINNISKIKEVNSINLNYPYEK